MDKILRVDMGAEGGPKFRIEPVGEFAGLGGRAMTTAIISKEVHPLCHPLGGENKLVIAPGSLSGTAASMSGRISVGCKSPLTGGIKESNAGGRTGLHMTHVTVGVVVLGIIALGHRSGRYPADYVEIAGLYWHFVDLVWMFIFPLVYLLSVQMG